MTTIQRISDFQTIEQLFIAYRSGERKGGDFAPTDQGGLRPIDESLYTDPVLLGQPEDFFEGGRLRNRDYLRKTLHLNSKVILREFLPTFSSKI